MTNIEIDRRLALAIGYTGDRVRVRREHWCTQPWIEVQNFANFGAPLYYGWRRFDHTDPAVIWPIAERFDAWPGAVSPSIPGKLRGAYYASALVGWTYSGDRVGEVAYHTNPATATALAVIKHIEEKQ